MTIPSADLRDLFEEALAQPPETRMAFLAARSADTATRERILRMIAADSEDDVVLERSVDAVARAIGENDETAALPPGARIGPFELIEILGEGGSSTVFRARREIDGVTQTVALKLLRRSMYSREAQRQFRRERLALAQLRHPGIARLIEGGVGEGGLAYIALDLVEGAPITEHARAQRLDLRGRLKLFLQVCRAVEAAHRALIVHRDLKPSNVLVTTEGEVKLLDFGIAKLLDADDETQTRLPAFTPAYAAPEQRTGAQVTTATDVYALGVLLGELVTGQRLNDGSGRTPSGHVSAENEPGVLPAAPAATRRQLRGDLDNIVLKAIAQEPERRYASAGALADDIERLLDRRPVAAHPPSAWYRTRKFVARHQGGVALTALFATGLLAALGLALWQADVARRSAARADAMRDFMISAFSKAEPGSPRSGPPSITDVVEQAIVKARVDSALDAGVRTELVADLGSVLSAQGRIKPARDVLQWNYDRALADFGGGARETLQAGHPLAASLILDGDFDAARSLIDRLLTPPPRDDRLGAALLFDSALLATKRHELQRARADGEAGLAKARRSGDVETLDQALSEYGNVELEIGSNDGAITAWSELLALRERRFGAEHVAVAATHADLSRALRRSRKLDEAEREVRAALAIDAATLPAEHWRRSNHLNALMMVQLDRRDYRAALESAKETLRIDQTIYTDDDHPERANDLNSVGMLYALVEDFPSAVAPLREALRHMEAKFGAEDYQAAWVRSNYGVVLAHSGDVAAGEAEIMHAISTFEHLAEPDLDEEAATWEKLARVRLEREDAIGALPAIERIDALLAKIGTPGAYWDGRAGALRGTALLQRGDAAGALAALDPASAALSRSAKPDAVLRVEIPLLQANAALALGRTRDADAFARSGRDALAGLANPPSRVIALARPFEAIPAPAP
jgi:serine/threonine-protein kinase